MVITICVKIDSKIQATDVTTFEKLIQLRTASLKVLERIVKTAPELYFDHIYRTLVVMQKFNASSAVEFVKNYLISHQQVVLTHESHIDSYLTCFYTLGRCLEKVSVSLHVRHSYLIPLSQENRFAEADKEYTHIWNYLDTLKKKHRIDNLTYDAHNVCALSHKILLYCMELNSSKRMILIEVIRY